MGQRKSKLSYNVTDSDHENVEIVNSSSNILKSSEVPKVDTTLPIEIDPEILKKVPQWVNEENFHEVLKCNVKGFKKIIDFKARPALGAGENYATLMLRVQINVELQDNSRKHLSYMLKVPHDSEQMKEMLKIMNFFEPENGMYFEVIPELEKMYKDIDEDICFAANAYKFPKDPGSLNVLLEDLGPLGFKNANRLNCLDMEHTKCVLEKMAKFHAASATRVAVKGPFPDIFMNGMFREDSKGIFDAMMSSFKTSFMENLKTYKNGELYARDMEIYFENMMSEFLRLTKHNMDEFNVLNHGDSWCNNILFKYDKNGKVSEVIFVDYQGPNFCSPAQDLLYFIMSSTNIDIKTKHFDFFIRYYHSHLIENLIALKYPKSLPSLRELHMQLFKYGSWALFASVIVLPIVLLDPTESASMENFISDNDDGANFKNLLFTNKKYHRYIGEILPFLYNRGMLSISEFLSSPKLEPKDNAKVVLNNGIPDWIDETYFTDVLQKSGNDFKKIKQFEVTKGTNAGDNYASIMLKIKIDIEANDSTQKAISYMLKVSPPGEQAKALLEMTNTFKKEKAMYQILSQFEEEFKNVGIPVVFGPNHYDFVKDPGCENILMEDLSPFGFKNGDRLKGLDLDHTKSVLLKLAQFHAVSAHYYTAQKEVPDIFMKGFYSEENRVMFQEMQKLFFDLFITSIKDYENIEEYKEKIESSKTMLYDVMIKCCEVDSNGFNVLNHGDCWTNNVMFKHDSSNKILETYFVDFQMVKYGSPSQDLYYFLLSSPSLDIKTDKFDYLIKYYYENLTKYLKLFNYQKKIPTLKELHMELLRYGAWGFSTVVGVMSAVLLDPTENANMENFFNDSDAGRNLKQQLYENPRYRAHAEILLTWLNRRGLLDFSFN